MWWLRRMTTAAMPWAAARSTARSTARAASQTPGSRRPSQVTAAPAVGDDVRLAARGHAPGLEFPEVGGRQLEPVRRVAEQVGLDQAGGDRRRLVAVAPGGGEQGGRVPHQVGGPVAHPFVGIRHRIVSPRK